MCIVVAKEKGVNLPSKDILKQCFRHNSDGAGLMFVNKGKVNIVKGFMEFDKFYDYLMKLDHIHNLKEKALVMHFRISTGGNVDGGNCHPYPVSAKEADLRKEYITCNLGMAHNGIISMYNRKNGVLNDTQQFILNCVSTIYAMDKEFYKKRKPMELLEDIAGSKLCLLDTEENIYYVGSFIEDEGIYYSNTSYIPYSYPSYGNYKYDYGWNYYDDYYGTPHYYYDDTAKKIGAKGSNKSVEEAKKSTEKLTKEEFATCIENITILNKGDKLVDEYGAKFEIDDDLCYGFDPFFNVYYIDWKEEDLYPLYYDCTITFSGDDDGETVVTSITTAKQQ